MKVKDLGKKIKILCSQRYTWIWLFLCTLCIGAVEFGKSSVTDNASGTLYDTSFLIPVLELLSAVACCNEFFRPFLVPSAESENGVLVGKALTEYARYHAFPTRDYFGHILKTWLPFHTVIVVEYFVFAFLERSNQKFIVAIAILVVPFVVGGMRLLLFEYELTHDVTLLRYGIGRGMVRILFWFLNIAIIIFTIILSELVGFSAISDHYAPADKGQMASVVFMEISDFFYVYLIFGVILSWMLIIFEGKKKHVIITVIDVVAVIGLGIISARDSTASYTKITGNEIVVVEDGQTYDYTFDDVDRCIIEEGNDDDDYEKKCTLELKDGRRVVFRDDYSCGSNEAWDDEYEDFFEYIDWLECAIEGNE